MGIFLLIKVFRWGSGFKGEGLGSCVSGEVKGEAPSTSKWGGLNEVWLSGEGLKMSSWGSIERELPYMEGGGESHESTRRRTRNHL